MGRALRDGRRGLATLMLCIAALGGCAATPHPEPARAPAQLQGWQAAVAVAPAEQQDAPATTAALTRGPEPTPRPAVTGPQHALTGIASYYWQQQMTSSGERFDRTALTAAHRTLPFGTRVRVTNLANGRSVTVRINDRGPFKPGRVIDLSEAAAKAIAMTAQGLAQVRVEVVR